MKILNCAFYFLCALCCPLAYALDEQTPLDSSKYGPYEFVQILEVVDGDTVKARVGLFPDIIQETFIHLASVDAPEVTVGVKAGQAIPYCERKAGKRAKRFATQFLKRGKVNLIDVTSGPRTAHVYGELYVNGKSLSQALLSIKLALALKGEKERIWPCKKST